MKNFRFLKDPKMLIAAGMLVAALVFVIYLCSLIGDVFGMTIGDGKICTVDIPAGSGTSHIAKILKNEGIIRHPIAFKIYEKLDGDNMFQQGRHSIGKGQSYKQIIKILNQNPENTVLETATFVVPEGFENWQIAELLEEKGLADKKEFLKLLDEGDFPFDFIGGIKRKENRLEGYLFPATYEVFVGESEYDIICRMLKAFTDNILPLYNEAKTDYTLDQIITMASLVEREAANDGERGKVASVFYNRLEIGMTLGSCATVQYIIKERKDVLSNSDTKIKSPYNTYINPGLPIGPIASVGVGSVKAALYPEKTDYLYFAAKSDGSANVFSKTHAQHIETVNRLQN